MQAPYLDDGDVRLYLGDCIEVMAEMDAESVDAVVCDPPYGLEFMGKEWDKHISPAAYAKWCLLWAAESLRVLKPGGHLLAFGGTRTFHRLTCGIEDAGFEIRDCLSWLYGSGFPKSLNVSKAIDKAAGVEREVIGKGTASCAWLARGEPCRGHGDANGRYRETIHAAVTAPATPDAAKWQGWGTALKPGWEPCIVARKPLTGTVAANVQQHGTGALNIDGCRIAHASEADLAQHAAGVAAIKARGGSMANSWKNSSDLSGANDVQPGGRWPANVVLDEQAAAMLDAQSGQSTAGATRDERGNGGMWDAGNGIPCGPQYGDTGGASRFYYTAKASRADRSTNGANNTHPTVKPTDLMRWLVRMVTPPGGVVLDPFAGSGSTLLAARLEGFRAIGIEREKEYAEIIAVRTSAQTMW